MVTILLSTRGIWKNFHILYILEKPRISPLIFFFFIIFYCRCLCSVTRVAGKGSSAVEYLIQVFFKHLDSHGVENKQVCELKIFTIVSNFYFTVLVIFMVLIMFVLYTIKIGIIG